MLESSIATAQLATGREVNRWQNDKSTTLGKPIPAEIRIEYEPQNTYTIEDIYDEIIDNLNQNNWQKEELNAEQSGFYRAFSERDGFTIKATVNLQSDKNIVSIRLRSSSH